MRTPVTVVLLFLVTALLPADVMFLRNGEILFGEIIAAGSGTVTIRSLGQSVDVLSTDIERTEPSLSALADLPVQVILKDGTIIKGKIVDFDEEIGIFVDIIFGNLVLPSATVDRIVDPSRAAKAAPASQWIGGSGNVSFPLSEDFGLSWGTGISWEFRTPWLADMKLGLSLSFESLSYKTDTQISFYNVGLSAYTIFTLDGLFQGLGIFSPYLGFGGGAVVVQAFDQRPSAVIDQRGLLTGLLTSQIGIEWRLPMRLLLRTGGSLDKVLQTGGVFLVPKANIGLYFGF